MEEKSEGYWDDKERRLIFLKSENINEEFEIIRSEIQERI